MYAPGQDQSIDIQVYSGITLTDGDLRSHFLLTFRSLQVHEKMSLDNKKHYEGLIFHISLLAKMLLAKTFFAERVVFSFQNHGFQT